MARASFARDRRLRRRADFVRLQRVGAKVTCPHFLLLVARQPAKEPTPPRLGIVATRKLGNAVVRNRIKRICRECFRQWPELLPPGVDLVVIPRAGAEALGLAEVRAEWQRAHSQLLARANQALAKAPEATHVSGAQSPVAPTVGDGPRSER